jgi:hypothetical protein
VAFTTVGVDSAREIRRGRILLLAADNRGDGEVAAATGCGRTAV